MATSKEPRAPVERPLILGKSDSRITDPAWVLYFQQLFVALGSTFKAIFNVTQPTLLDGEQTDLRATSRGALIVAPGVEGFTVTADAGSNLAHESGGNLAAMKAVADKLTFDTASTDLIENDHSHNEIHAGTNFFFTDAITLGATSQSYMFTTGVKPAHFLFYIDFLFVTQVQIFEAGDRVGTTAQTAVNSNRNSINATTATLHKGTSGGTTDGIQIFNYASGVSAGTGSNRITGGGNLQGRNEIVLRANTKYIIKITSSTAANLINMLLTWYEL